MSASSTLKTGFVQNLDFIEEVPQFSGFRSSLYI